MEQIPTAEGFLQGHHQISHFYDDKTNQMVCFSSDMQKAMIEFAKLHVEAALEAAANEYYPKDKENFEIVAGRFINAYSLDKIK